MKTIYTGPSKDEAEAAAEEWFEGHGYDEEDYLYDGDYTYLGMKEFLHINPSEKCFAAVRYSGPTEEDFIEYPASAGSSSDLKKLNLLPALTDGHYYFYQIKNGSWGLVRARNENIASVIVAEAYGGCDGKSFAPKSVRLTKLDTANDQIIEMGNVLQLGKN